MANMTQLETAGTARNEKAPGLMLALGLIGLWAIMPAQSEGSATPGTWTAKAPMPAVRNEVAAAAVDGEIYVLGGSVGAGQADFARNEEDDPATDTWRVRAPLPRGANHMSAVAANGKVYAFGGFAGAQHHDAVDRAFEYDPAADSWKALAPLKKPLGSIGVAAVAGKIH